MKRFISFLLKGKVMLLLFACGAALSGVLLYHLYYPPFNVDQLIRYQVRMNQAINMAQAGELSLVNAKTVEAFGETYDKAFRLPMLFANLSYKAVIYCRSGENGSSYLFVCGLDENEISKAYLYSEQPSGSTLHEKVLPNWSVEERT